MTTVSNGTCLHSLYASPTSRLALQNGFAFSMQVLPLRLACTIKLDHAAPTAHSITGLPPCYGQLRPCASHRCSGSCGGYPLERLPSHREDRFHRSLSKPESRSRRLHAGRRLSSRQAPCSTPCRSLLSGHDPIADFVAPDRFRLHKREYRLLLVTVLLEDLVIAIPQDHPGLRQITSVVGGALMQKL
jgi:hypothetical protein